MKRFYLKWTMAAMAALFMVLPVNGEPVRRLSSEQSTRTINREGQKQILSFRQLWNRQGNVLGDGLEAAPTEEQNQHSIAAERPVAMRHAPATRSAEEPRGNLFTVVPQFNGGTGYPDAFWGKLNMGTGEISKIYTGSVYCNNEDYDLQGGCVADGILYIPQYLQDMVTGEIEIIWKRVVIETGERLSNISFGSEMDAFFYSMAWHPERKTFVGLGMNLSSQTTGELFEIDLNSGKPQITYLGNVGSTGQDFMAALCYCPRDQEIYGLTAEGNFYTLNLSPDATQRKNICVEFDTMDSYYILPSDGQPACLAYSPLDNQFVTIYRDELNFQIIISFIDFEDYSTYMGPVVNYRGNQWIGYNASIHCLDQYADNNAPADCQLTDFTLTKAELTGSYTFKAPTEYYSGIALTGADANKQITVKVDMDGTLLETVTVTPGQTHTGTFTVTQGNHKLNLRPEFDNLEGPVTTRAFWAGNDHPNAPTNVKFVNNVVTWKAVGGTGENGGYVDAAAITYDVYFDGVKQNTEPITGTSFTCPVPEKMARRVLTVTASANGMTSPASTALEIVNGKPLTLPQAFTPTQQQSTLFQNENTNNDAYTFKFYSTSALSYMGLGITDYYGSPNDWLFMPQMHFDDADMLYNIAFTYSNFYTTSDKQQSNIEVFIGKEPNSKAMTKMIYSREGANVMEPINVNTNFVIDEPGDYYIGFHTSLVTTNQSRGVRLYNFNVAELDTPTTVPGSETNVKLSPADAGELQAVITLTLPTVDVVGKPLDPNKQVTAYARVIGDFDELTAQASGLPGQTITFNCETYIDGYSFVLINMGNEYGKGIEHTYRVFTGFDVPGRPLNVRGIPSSDNTYVDLYWDAPTTGLNGGYIDPNEITYDISLYGGAANYNKIGQTKECHYRYNVGDIKQQYVYVGPSATNRIGTSTMNTFYYDVLGRPHEMPVVETFQSQGGTSFLYGPWRYNAEGHFADCVFSHATNLNGLGIGDPVPNGGLFVAQYLGDGGSLHQGELICPKVTTKGVDEPYFGLTYWNYEYAGSMEIYGRHDGQIEYEKLFDIMPTRDAREWVEFSQALPESYKDRGWVQFRVRTTLTANNNSLCVLDELKVFMDVDNDFKAAKVSGPQYTWVGEAPTYEATILNSGMGTGMTNFAIELLGDGKVLVRNDFATSRLAANQSYIKQMNIDMKQEYLQYEKLQVRVRNLDEDEVAYNDERTLDITLVDCQLPTVSATAKWADDNHSAALVEWNQPSLAYGSDEAFEFEEPFALADNIAGFQNIDLDKTIPFKFENRRFPNDDTPCAWVVIDHNDLRTASDERLSAHSGSKFLLARSAQFDEYGNEEPVQSDDWLISPEIVGGTEVSFWFNTVNSSYAETVEIWYSTTGTNVNPDGATRDASTGTYVCGDFKRVRPFTKVADEDTWDYCSVKLPADAKYFALVYCSWGQFGGCIDDLAFTPAQISNYELAGFDVWRRLNNDWSTYELVGKDLKTNSFTDSTVGDKNAGYFVVTKVTRNGVTKSGARSDEAKLYSTLVDDLSQLEGVFGGHGIITVAGHEGETLALYNAEGKHLRQLTIDADRFQTEIEAGVYVVKAGNKIAKVVVR